MSNMGEFFKTKQTKKSAQELSKSDKSISQGPLELQRYRNYYDISNSITTVQATDPNDPDNANYNQERIFESLERNAEKLWVANDAAAQGATLFVIASHEGGQNFSRERPIYPQQAKVYYNIYEIRLRSTAQINYRVTEYQLGSL